MSTPTFSRIARTYSKHNEINPDSVHSNYAKWQQEKFGNVLEGSDEETDDDMDDLLEEFSNHDND